MTAPKLEALFIPSQQAIFTVYYPPEAPLRNEVIVICPPAPQDMMRSHASLVQMAKRLQSEGFAVLRFDYSGTGDSAGSAELVSLQAWLQDIISVCGWAKFHTRAAKLSLIGLRLGADLCVQASLHLKLERLILWDPVLDGIAYLQAMEASHQSMLHRNPIEPPFPSTDKPSDQCWGFPWKAAFRSEIAGISPAVPAPRAQSSHLVTGRQQPFAKTVYKLWQEKAANIVLHELDDDLRWNDDQVMKTRVFTGPYLRLIEDICTGVGDG